MEKPNGPSESISISSLLIAQKCKRRFYFNTIRQLELAGEEPHYFSLGRALHYVVEATLREKFNVRDLEKFGVVDPKDARMLQRFVPVIQDYMQGWELLDVEYRLDDPPIYAISDLRVKVPGRGIGIIDIKSTSSIPDPMVFLLDQQGAIEAHLAQQHKKAFDFSGFLFLNKKNISCELYFATPPVELRQNIVANLKDVAVDLDKRKKALATGTICELAFPPNGGLGGACLEGPFKKCPFLQVCAHTGDKMEHILSTAYQSRRRR